MSAAFDDRSTAAPRQMNIEENDVWRGSGDDRNGLGHISGLTHSLYSVAEFGDHPGTKQRVIIDDDHRWYSTHAVALDPAKDVPGDSGAAVGPAVGALFGTVIGTVIDTSVPMPSVE